MPLSVIPLKAKRQNGNFVLFEEITRALSENQISLESGDVIVISSKYVSNSQGRILDTTNITASSNSAHISNKFKLKPKFAEVILRESDKIFGGVSGFVITSSDDILAPNAGIDKSNSQGKLILYPDEPYLVAEQIKRKFFLDYGIHIGVIIVDSRLMPARVGTSGVAIACSGIEPVLDRRTTKDLDGNALKVTFQATADNLASIANHKMGEADELLPIAIVRESGAKLTNRKISSDETAIPHDQCVYVRGLKKS